MILIVADARRSTRAQLRAAMREVEHVRGKLAGCVLDNVGRRHRLRSGRPEPVADSGALTRPWWPATGSIAHEHEAADSGRDEADHRQDASSGAALDGQRPGTMAEDDR